MGERPECDGEPGEATEEGLSLPDLHFLTTMSVVWGEAEGTGSGKGAAAELRLVMREAATSNGTLARCWGSRCEGPHPAGPH